MIQLKSLNALTQALSGTLMGEDHAFDALSIDTRTLKPGDLFIALKGPNFDGHQFLAQALEKGASGALVSDVQDMALSQIKVPDTRLALGHIGHKNRQAFHGHLTALTGSSGKTTVKAMLSQMCALQGPTLATAGNLNNDYGVPLTLSRIESEHQYAVIELGANAPGEIAYTSRLSCPDTVILNNVTGAHLEGFGTLDELAQAKAEIIEGLSPHGVVIINRDDHYYDYWKQSCRSHQYLSFSLSSLGDVWASQIQFTDQGSAFILNLLGRTLPIVLPVRGQHQIANALAASTAAHVMGINDHHIQAALQGFHPLAGRGNTLIGRGDTLLIDDTYNANPGSMKAAVDVLSSYKDRERWLVIGDMGELGAGAQEQHALIGRYAKQCGIDKLLTLGELSSYSSEAFGVGAQHFTSQAQMQTYLWNAPADKARVIVFKGSRSARMEVLLQACMADPSKEA